MPSRMLRQPGACAMSAQNPESQPYVSKKRQHTQHEASAGSSKFKRASPLSSRQQTVTKTPDCHPRHCGPTSTTFHVYMSSIRAGITLRSRIPSILEHRANSLPTLPCHILKAIGWCCAILDSSQVRQKKSRPCSLARSVGTFERSTKSTWTGIELDLTCPALEHFGLRNLQRLASEVLSLYSYRRSLAAPIQLAVHGLCGLRGRQIPAGTPQRIWSYVVVGPYCLNLMQRCASFTTVARRSVRCLMINSILRCSLAIFKPSNSCASPPRQWATTV